MNITTISLLLILILIAQLNQTAFANVNSYEINSNIEHNVQIKDGGLVVINTLIDLQNNGLVSVSSLKIGFSKDFEQNLDDVVAYEMQELTVIKEGVKNDISWVDIGLTKAIEHGQTVNLSIFFIFSRLIIPDQSNVSNYLVVFPTTPTLPFDVEHCDVKINLPQGITVNKSSLSGVLEETVAPLKANSTQVGYLSFTGEFHILECNYAMNEAVLNEESNLHLYNSYNIRNIGRESVSNVVLALPTDAKEVSAYDTGGSLNIEVTEGDAKKVSVILRYPLRGTENTIIYDDSCSFTVSYRVTNRLYITSLDTWFNYRFRFIPAFLNFTLKKLEVKVILPEGAKYLTASSIGNISIKGLTPTIEYNFKNIAPQHMPSLSIDYNYNTFWVALRPSFWIGSIGIVISILAFQRRRRQPIPVIFNKNTEKIKSFTEICDERIMLSSEIDTLEKRIDNKEIGRKDFNRRKKIMQQRLSTLDEAFAGLKNEVRQIDPRYALLINKLEKAEAEIVVQRENIEKFRIQNRSGKLSKRVYKELEENYEKKVESAKRTIESIIIELKAES